jgi:UDP-glucose 4-epimerase
LVTGGAGFVGSHLVEALRRCGDEVAVYDITTGGDLFDTNTLRHVMRGQDVVYHFAARAEPHKSNPTTDLEQNLLGTAEVLEAMREMHVPRIVFASSSSVYGDCQVFPTPEDAPMSNQTSLYGASKVAAEALISAYTRTFGMTATIFRFAPMLGEGYRRGHVIDFWRKLKANPECIEILGDGEQQRSYVYVKDAVLAVVNVSVLGTFNVSGDETPTVNQSLEWICEVMGVHPRRVYTGDSWSGDKRLTWLDTSRLRALGWSPTVSVREAVERTVRSFE